MIPKYKNYTITKIKGDKIILSKTSGKVKVGKTIKRESLGNLSKAYCISTQNKPAGYLFMGICEFRRKNYAKAENHFKKTGLLADALIHQMTKKQDAEKLSSMDKGLTEVSVDKIPLEVIQKIFNGKVRAWEPKTRKITLVYNFNDKKQLNDWIGKYVKPELYQDALLLDTAKKRTGRVLFKVPIVLSDLQLDILPTSADFVWWFNNKNVNVLNKAMHGAMRHGNYHGGSCIYGKVGRTSNLNSNNPKKAYKINIGIENDNLVWKRNGKTFLAHHYTQGGEELAIGGWNGQIIFDNIALKGVLNRDWLKKELKGLKEEADLKKAVSNGKCKLPDDVKYFRGHAYKYYDTPKGWKEAKAFCEELGGHLVTISDKWENEFARSLGVLDNKEIRIGLQKLGPKKSDYIWCTGEKMTYLNWAKGEPNNRKNKERVAAFYSGSTWNDNPVQEEFPFICEWEASKENRFKLIVTLKTANKKHADTKNWLYVLINGDEELKYGLDDYYKRDYRIGGNGCF